MRFLSFGFFFSLFFHINLSFFNLVHKIITQLVFSNLKPQNPKSCPPPSSSLDNNNPSNFNAHPLIHISTPPPLSYTNPTFPVPHHSQCARGFIATESVKQTLRVEEESFFLGGR